MIELLGLLLPPLIDLINRRIKDEDGRFWISVIVCSLVGLAINFLTNSNHLGDQESIAKSILTVFGSAQLSYRGFWKSTAVHEKIVPQSKKTK